MADNANGEEESIETDQRDFGLTLLELMEIMQARGEEGKLKIDKVGGVEGVLHKLRSNQRTGLRDDELELRREVFGSNRLPKSYQKTFLSLCWDALIDPVLLVLVGCALISLGFSFYVPNQEEEYCMDDDLKIQVKKIEGVSMELIEGIAILAAVVIVVLVSAINNWKKERQFRNLQEKVEGDKMVTVLRIAGVLEINVEDVVVGDIMIINYGDLLVADGLVVQARELSMDESALTGESVLVKKSKDKDSKVLAGTTVMEGSGKVLVTAVGMNSMSGQILEMMGFKQEGSKINQKIKAKGKLKKVMGHQTEKSVLATKLLKLTKQIGFIGLCVALLTVVVLCTKYGIAKYQKECYVIFTDIIKFLITGITILVVAIPEGLPLAVTIALAYSVRKMMKDNNLVRHLDACETMGNATTICTDKTGTLTTNRMTVVVMYIFEQTFTRNNFDTKDKIEETIVTLLSQAISFNTSYTTNLEEKEGNITHVGNKTECALLGLLQDLGIDYRKIRENMSDTDFIKIFPFNSSLKRMSTVVPLREGGYRVFTKGAAEVIIDRCMGMVDEQGGFKQLLEVDRERIRNKVIKEMAGNSLRIICVAYKNISVALNWDDVVEDEVSKDLIMLCIVGIEDPVRDEVPLAIEQCHLAGITVRMVTGDNKDTARAIAIKCGIIKPDTSFLVMDGKEFNERVRDPVTGEVKQVLMDKVWPNLRVLARCQPRDKYLLVRGIISSKLTKNREVVAVTGDGTNDAPALKEADVGFAMGISGTDVAKEASDIILTDDNFNSIVAAVLWGRNVYDSISKFLQFQLTVNMVAIVIAFIGACVTNASPLRAVQMLWVNLIMDSLAALALATEAPDPSLLNRMPYGRTASLISTHMARSMVAQVVYQVTILLVMLFLGHKLLPGVTRSYRTISIHTPPTKLFTMIFNTFLQMTLFNEINCRKVHGEINVFKGIFSNHIFYLIWTASFTAQILIVQFGSTVFFTTPLSMIQWLVCLGLGLGVMLWHQVGLLVERVWIEMFNTSSVYAIAKHSAEGIHIEGLRVEQAS